MGPIEDYLDPLVAVDSLPSTDAIREKLGSDAWEQAEKSLERYGLARALLLAVNGEPIEEFGRSTLQNARQAAGQLGQQMTSYIDAMRRGDVNSALNTIQNAENQADQILDSLRPVVKGGSVQWAAESDRASQLLQQAQEAQRKADEVLALTDDIARGVGIGELTKACEAESARHDSQSKVWLWAVAVTVAALASIGLWALLTAPEGTAWEAHLSWAASKAVLVGALAYALSFSARNYRVNVHLTAVYRQRAAALNTYKLMSKAMEDDDQSRAILLTKLAEAVFAPSDPGVHTAHGDTTVIETNIPWAGSASATAR